LATHGILLLPNHGKGKTMNYPDLNRPLRCAVLTADIDFILTLLLTFWLAG
jgi:hypothetical protein